MAGSDRETGTSISYGGVSVNSSALTTSISAIAEAEVVCYSNKGNDAHNFACAGMHYFKAGDILRWHTNANNNGNNTDVRFMVYRIGPG